MKSEQLQYVIKEIYGRLGRIERKLDLVLQKQETETMTLADLQAKVTAQKTVADSTVALLQGLKAQLDAAIATGNMAAIQAISDGIDANTNELAAAVTANTPAAAASA